MTTGVRCLLFLAFAAIFSAVFADDLALDVGHTTALKVVPNVIVRNSPGLKPDSEVLAERVHICGLSRMKNLKRFSHSVTVKLSNLTSLHHPKVEVCFHRNFSLGVGMCPQSHWQKLSKGSWARKMSPFDQKILDIRMASSSPEALELTVEEEFSPYRIVFLFLGTVLIMVASTLSESLIFYYSSAMVVGIILVILIVLFQGMKLLPTGRPNSLALFVYSSLIGVGSFLLRYLPRLLRTMLAEIGISEDMYNPLAIFFLLFISLAGAWLGFWVVHKLVLTEDGSIDTTMSQFVAWSIRILGAVMILQCSLDPLLAAEALASAIFVSSSFRRATKSRRLRRLYRKLRKMARSGHHNTVDYDHSPIDGRHAKHINDFQYSQDMFLSPQSRRTSQASRFTPMEGLTTKSPPSESEPFYSTYHNTPQRRKFSDDEWKSFTKECTKKGLEELVSSPEFNRWAVAHADRITLAPIEKEQGNAGGWRRWFPWFR